MFKTNYTKAITILLLLTTLSGVVRKWITTSGAINNGLLGLVLLTPLLLFFIKDENNFNKENHAIFNVYIFFLIICAINPLNNTFYHGLLGLPLHLAFFSILCSAFKNIDNFDAKLFAYLSVGLLIMEIILGSIQYVSPAGSFINRYAVEEGQDSDIALVGNAIRVTGTFSYIAGFSAFLYLGLFTSFYLIKKEIFGQYSYILLLMVLYGGLISGSRGAVGFILLTILVFFIFEAKKLFDTKVIFNLIVIIFTFIFFNTLLGDPANIYSKFENSYNNFSKRVESNSDEGESRIFRDIDDVMSSNFDYKLTGIGLGSTYQGANLLFGQSKLLNGIVYEGELYRIVIEGGFLLLVLRFLVLTYFLSKMSFRLSFKIYLFIIINLIVPIVYNVYSSIYLGLGLILLNQAYLPEKVIDNEK